MTTDPNFFGGLPDGDVRSQFAPARGAARWTSHGGKPLSPQGQKKG